MAVTPFSWSGEFVVKKAWKDVMRAAQTKYPNPFNPNILTIDIISRNIDEQTGVLRTTKLINSSWPMFSNAGELRAIERTEVDPQKQYMVLESMNIDMRGVFKAKERLEYEVHPENAEWTLIRHNVSVDAFRFIAYAALSVSQKTARSGREALNWVIENRVDNFMERVPAIPSFTAQTSSSSRKLAPLFQLDRLRSFKMPSLRPVVAFANTGQSPPASLSSSLIKRTCSTNSLPVSLERVITSFDSFHPTETLEEIKGRVTTDVTVLRERLRIRCQRVLNRFAKVDEYFLIM